MIDPDRVTVEYRARDDAEDLVSLRIREEYSEGAAYTTARVYRDLLGEAAEAVVEEDDEGVLVEASSDDLRQAHALGVLGLVTQGLFQRASVELDEEGELIELLGLEAYRADDEDGDEGRRGFA